MTGNANRPGRRAGGGAKTRIQSQFGGKQLNFLRLPPQPQRDAGRSAPRCPLTLTLPSLRDGSLPASGFRRLRRRSLRHPQSGRGARGASAEQIECVAEAAREAAFMGAEALQFLPFGLVGEKRRFVAGAAGDAPHQVDGAKNRSQSILVGRREARGEVVEQRRECRLVLARQQGVDGAQPVLQAVTRDPRFARGRAGPRAAQRVAPVRRDLRCARHTNKYRTYVEPRKAQPRQAGGTVRIRLPDGSTSAAQAGSTTVVQSSCWRMAGPSKRAPKGSRSRS